MKRSCLAPHFVHVIVAAALCDLTAGSNLRFTDTGLQTLKSFPERGRPLSPEVLSRNATPLMPSDNRYHATVGVQTWLFVASRVLPPMYLSGRRGRFDRCELLQDTVGVLCVGRDEP
jgi:hypothetical protein